MEDRYKKDKEVEIEKKKIKPNIEFISLDDEKSNSNKTLKSY